MVNGARKVNAWWTGQADVITFAKPEDKKKFNFKVFGFKVFKIYSIPSLHFPLCTLWLIYYGLAWLRGKVLLQIARQRLE